MPIVRSRRHFLTQLGIASVAGLGGAGARSFAAEPPPEITTVRFVKSPVICVAPQFVAAELLRAEGFTDIRYVAAPRLGSGDYLVSGEVDFSLEVPWDMVAKIEAGEPITLLAGVMVGCYELFGNEGVRGITDLKGKSLGTQGAGSTRIGLPTLLAASVGLDPAKDIDWVTDPSRQPFDLFKQGKIDAFLGFPPEPQELRARHIGHVIVNTAVDHPWSQYFCCMLVGNRKFVRNYPHATKRVMRAILKAADICASDPARAARQLVDSGVTPRYDYALQTLGELPYDKWREYDAEDTVRFYTLRMHEVGFIKSSPRKIIAEGTDWRFLNELKRELKT
jgi:NitT/TauT family transport system substrate-binding protein